MAQQKYGPAIYDKMGLTDEEQAEIQQALEKQGEQYEQNDLDNLIKTGVKGSYDFIEKTIKDFEELIKNNPNHPKVPQVKAELAKLRPQLAQARKDSGMGESQDDEVEESGLQYYTGKKKYGKEGMAALAQAGRDGASEEELGRIKDKYKKESEDLRRLAGL